MVDAQVCTLFLYTWKRPYKLQGHMVKCPKRRPIHALSFYTGLVIACIQLPNYKKKRNIREMKKTSIIHNSVILMPLELSYALLLGHNEALKN